MLLSGPQASVTLSLLLSTYTNCNKVCRPDHLCAKLALLFYKTNLSIQAAGSQSPGWGVATCTRI